MLPNSFCGTNSVKKFSITFTNFPHSISPRSLIGIIKNYANLVKTWIWTQSIWRQGKTSEMHKLEGKSHKGEKEGREVLTWSPFDTWHTLHHWNGIVVIWFVARGVLRWRVHCWKQRWKLEVTCICNLIPIQQKGQQLTQNHFPPKLPSFRLFWILC